MGSEIRMSDPMAFPFVRLALNNLGSHKCGPARTHTETIHRYDDLLYGLFWDIHIKLHCDGYSHGLVPTGYSLFGMVRISTHDSEGNDYCLLAYCVCICIGFADTQSPPSSTHDLVLQYCGEESLSYWIQIPYISYWTGWS